MIWFRITFKIGDKEFTEAWRDLPRAGDLIMLADLEVEEGERPHMVKQIVWEQGSGDRSLIPVTLYLDREATSTERAEILKIRMESLLARADNYKDW